MVKTPANLGFQVRAVVGFSIHAPDLADISLTRIVGETLSFLP
jgi:hypothetical protein